MLIKTLIELVHVDVGPQTQKRQIEDNTFGFLHEGELDVQGYGSSKTEHQQLTSATTMEDNPKNHEQIGPAGAKIMKNEVPGSSWR